jgi:hypothetical protein
MKKQPISRRSFLKGMGQTLLAAVAGGILKFVPEAQAVFASEGIARKDDIVGSSYAPPVDDPAYQSAIVSIESSKEHRQLKSKLTSLFPPDYWVDADTGLRFASFIVQAAPVSNDHFKEMPLQLMQTLIFAVGTNNIVADVFLLKPDVDSLSHNSKLKSVLQSLRNATVENVEHNETVTAKVREKADQIRKLKIEAQVAALKSRSKDAPVPLGCTPYCDCTTTTMYICCGQTCGGGYEDEGCYWTCSLLCVALPNPAARIACMVACRGACWVPAYCYCSCWRCRGCAC